jgi:hypothetical protein
MRVMLATMSIIAAALVPAEAATSQANHVVLTWEQCHIQTLRGGFIPAAWTSDS